MGLITDRQAPEDIPTTNALDALGLGNDESPPAFLSFGRSHAELDNPPARGEVRTYLVRVKCTGEHVSERTDGEIRHSRSMRIITCWEEGKPKPPDADEDQPGLYDDELQDADEDPDGND